jgi:cytochrome P450
MVSINEAKTSTNFPPGPKGNFLFGVLPDYNRDPVGFTAKCAREYGDIVLWKSALFNAYLLNHPDHIQEVLVTKSKLFQKSFGLQMLRGLFGNGLVTSESDFWQHQRRLIQPAFHRERIFGYGQIMVDYTQKQINSWQDGEIRDIHQEMMELTLSIVAKTLMEANLQKQIKTIGNAMETTIKYFEARMENLLLFLLPEWFPTATNLRYQWLITQLNKMIYSLIEERRASGEEKGDLLSMLLLIRDEDGNGMSNKQLRDEIATMIFAGHETTALTMSWTFYLLTKYPEVEKRLLEELQTVLKGRPVTVSDLPQLQYTEKVIMESMRLYPPAWLMGRTALEDCEIGGFPLHAGDVVLISQWTMHHDPRYFDNPEEFNPSRWENDLAKKLPTFAYFPFGGGSRICIGKSFAMMEAVLLLATIIQNYRLQLVPGQNMKPWAALSLRPKDGMKMLLTKR